MVVRSCGSSDRYRISGVLCRRGSGSGLQQALRLQQLKHLNRGNDDDDKGGKQEKGSRELRQEGEVRRASPALRRSRHSPPQRQSSLSLQCNPKSFPSPLSAAALGMHDKEIPTPPTSPVTHARSQTNRPHKHAPSFRRLRADNGLCVSDSMEGDDESSEGMEQQGRGRRSRPINWRWLWRGTKKTGAWEGDLPALSYVIGGAAGAWWMNEGTVGHVGRPHCWPLRSVHVPGPSLVRAPTLSPVFARCGVRTPALQGSNYTVHVAVWARGRCF